MSPFRPAKILSRHLSARLILSQALRLRPTPKPLFLLLEVNVQCRLTGLFLTW